MKSSVLRKAISVVLLGATLMAGSGICVSATSGSGGQSAVSGGVVSVKGDTVGTAVQVDDCIKVVNRVSGVGVCDVISRNPTGRVGVWELYSRESYVWYENGVFPFYKVKDELGNSVAVDMTYLETQVFVRETGAKSWKKVATGKDGRVNVDFGKDGVFDICIKARVRMSSFENNAQGVTEKWIKEYYNSVSVGDTSTLGLYGSHISAYAGMDIDVKWGSSDSLNKYFSGNYANSKYFESKVMKATKNVSVAVSDVPSGLKKVELWYRPTGTTTWKRMSYASADKNGALLDWKMDKAGKYDFLVKSFSNAGGVHRAYAMGIEVGVDDICSREGYTPVYYEGVQGLLPFSFIAMCKKGTYYITSASDFEKGTGVKWTKIKSGGDNGFVATSDEWEEVFYAFDKAGEYVVAFKMDGYTLYTEVLVVKEDNVIDFSTAENFKEIDRARKNVESAKEAFNGDYEGYEGYMDAWEKYGDTINTYGGGIIKEVVSNSVSSINVMDCGNIAFAGYDDEVRGYCFDYDAVMPVWGDERHGLYSRSMSALAYYYGKQFFGRDYFDVSHVDKVEVSREGFGYRTVFDVSEIDKYVDEWGGCPAVIGTGLYDIRITYTWFGKQCTKVLKNVPVFDNGYGGTELNSIEFSLSNGGENPYDSAVSFVYLDRFDDMWLGGNRAWSICTDGVQDVQVFVRKSGTKSWKNVTLGFRNGVTEEGVFINVDAPRDGGFYDVCLKVKKLEDGASKWRKIYFKDVAFETYGNNSLRGLYSFDTLFFSGAVVNDCNEVASVFVSDVNEWFSFVADDGHFDKATMRVGMSAEVVFTDIYYAKQSDYENGTPSWKRLGRVYSGKSSDIKLDAEGEYVVAFKGYDKNKKVVRTLYVEDVTVV